MSLGRNAERTHRLLETERDEANHEEGRNRHDSLKFNECVRHQKQIE